MQTFRKEVFVRISMERMGTLGIKPQDMADDLNVSLKTLGYYLDITRPELPKLSKFVEWFQYLNTSPGRVLLGMGPKHIDPESAVTLYKITELIANPSKPAYRAILNVLQELDYSDVEHISEHLELYVQHKRPLNEH